LEEGGPFLEERIPPRRQGLKPAQDRPEIIGHRDAAIRLPLGRPPPELADLVGPGLDMDHAGLQVKIFPAEVPDLADPRTRQRCEKERRPPQYPGGIRPLQPRPPLSYETLFTFRENIPVTIIRRPGPGGPPAGDAAIRPVHEATRNI
jgi:hypothetical protein